MMQTLQRPEQPPLMGSLLMFPHAGVSKENTPQCESFTLRWLFFWLRILSFCSFISSPVSENVLLMCAAPCTASLPNPLHPSQVAGKTHVAVKQQTLLVSSVPCFYYKHCG